MSYEYSSFNTTVPIADGKNYRRHGSIEMCDATVKKSNASIECSACFHLQLEGTPKNKHAGRAGSKVKVAVKTSVFLLLLRMTDAATPADCIAISVCDAYVGVHH